MKTQESGFVDLLLKGELEAVTRGLEDGIYSWEELDQPDTAHGSTPLITACQMGLDMVMRFLLEKGADATLCNQSNQTALHVSQPDLQKELLSAMLRRLSHRAQILEVAWRGDIQALQHLLHECDSVDVNIQNQNGLTPLMLAVRDVDLFEGFRGTMEWDYDSTQVVKTLLDQSADPDIQDYRSCTVLTYVCQIKSSMKDELLQIILNHQTHAVPSSALPEFHFPAERCNNFHSLPSQVFSTLAKPWPKVCGRGTHFKTMVSLNGNSITGDTPHTCVPTIYTLPNASNIKDAKEPYAYIAVLDDNKNVHEDKIIALCFGSAMEPKTNIKSSGRTTLPRLKEKNACWAKFGILYPTCDVRRKTSSVPIPPKLTEKGTSIFQTPPVPHLSQLSQSTPRMDLLDASFLLQVRTNIHNRLSTSQDAGQKDAHPVLSLRTPKHLAPLDQEYRKGHILPNDQSSLAPKPIGILSSDSEEMRKRLYRLGSGGSTSTGRGSEESSCSSQSSLDEEDEEEKSPQVQIFGREPPVALKRPSSMQSLMNFESSEHINSNIAIPIKTTFIRNQKGDSETTQNHESKLSKTVEPFERTLNTQQLSDARNVCKENTALYFADITKINKKVEPAPKFGQSSSFSDPDQHQATPVNIALQLGAAETCKSRKIIRAEETKCRSSQVNTRRDYSKSKKNTSQSSLVICQSSNVIIKEKGLLGKVNSEEKLDWSKSAPLNHGPKLKATPTNRRRNSESPLQARPSGTKKTSSKTQGQKQLFNRDQRKATRQAKRPGILGTQRTKSSLDYVSYQDMFLEIHQEAEGPAIFEMFATPIYENLRAGSSVLRPQKVQSAIQLKRQPSGQQKVQRPVEVNRRKQKCTTSKVKRKRKVIQPPEPQSYDQTIGVNPNDAGVIEQKGKHIPPTTKEDETHDSDTISQTKGNSVLSMIREVPSDTDIRLVFLNQQEDSSSLFHPHRTLSLSMQFLQGDVIANVTEDPIAVQLPSQPLINTWTTERTKSPEYQRCLDEVGEGNVTDDLLKCLAEELISLEEREVGSVKSENQEMTNAASPKSNEEVIPLDNRHCNKRSSVDNTITWTKGEILGRGAYGTVYCGLTGQGKLIAVKQVTWGLSNSETAEKEYKQLEREVDLLRNLHHQNIVGFLGTALSSNVISILMEYVPGGSISNVLKRFGPLPEKVFALYTQQILEGVGYLHNNRVIHRDLKGNNIMLMPSGIIKLIDFGCARRLNRLTRSGSQSDFFKSVHGTPYWMAPEVINETGHGKKSDIWSIGCTVFEMATGKPPLAHMGKMAALFYIGAKKGLMPSLPDEFSTEAKEFVKACLVNDSKQRPSAADLLRHSFVSHLRLSESSRLLNVHQ